MSLYVYVCRQTYLVCVCMYVSMYVLTSMFMQAGMHEYLGMYICIDAGRYMYTIL